jgi:large subunit ribosomal protein L9
VKVIFVADVPSVAKVGQTKEVANGYARNYLFPRKLAVLANSSTAAALEAHLKKLIKQHAILEAEMAEFAKKIEGTEVVLRVKVGEHDKLYGSVTAADIATALTNIVGREIEKKHVVLNEPIKMAGTKDVMVRFMHEVSAMVKVRVMDENAREEAVAAPEAKAETAEAPAEAAEAAPKKEKKAKAAKAEAVAEAPAEAAAETAEAAPKKEKKAKAKKAAAEEPAAEVKAEAPAAEEKPAKAKKAKAEKAVKEEAPAAEPEAKKEKKPRAKKEKAAE